MRVLNTISLRCIGLGKLRATVQVPSRTGSIHAVTVATLSRAQLTDCAYSAVHVVPRKPAQQVPERQRMPLNSTG